jgi:hypothetical protein
MFLIMMMSMRALAKNVLSSANKPTVQSRIILLFSPRPDQDPKTITQQVIRERVSDPHESRFTFLPLCILFCVSVSFPLLNSPCVSCSVYSVSGPRFLYPDVPSGLNNEELPVQFRQSLAQNTPNLQVNQRVSVTLLHLTEMPDFSAGRGQGE